LTLNCFAVFMLSMTLACTPPNTRIEAPGNSASWSLTPPAKGVLAVVERIVSFAIVLLRGIKWDLTEE
jgi:hypothetical protein